MRLLTKQSKKVAGTGKAARRSTSKRGLIVESAEGVRFAYTSTRLPTAPKNHNK